ncbi:FimD/PapC N-terminal domain-containing protein [Escherichia coli]|uniref:FimD/PapC N-terminal domain-containing protein n=1 Tax=Escherichia coli TaxID=562 RepID=UPI003CC9973D
MDTVNIYRLSFVSCLVMAMPCALAVEFNLNVLDKSMRDRIDISLLKEKGVIAPGEYFVSVAVNNNQIPRFYVSTSKSIIKALINMHSFEIQLSPIG